MNRRRFLGSAAVIGAALALKARNVQVPSSWWLVVEADSVGRISSRDHDAKPQLLVASPGKVILGLIEVKPAYAGTWVAS